MQTPLGVGDGLLTVDRKFHIGTPRYADLIHSPIMTVNPPLQDGEMIMDANEVPTAT